MGKGKATRKDAARCRLLWFTRGRGGKSGVVCQEKAAAPKKKGKTYTRKGVTT